MSAKTPFELALKHTLAVEGDFSDDPDDSGGATNWGITESVARAFGYVGDMRFLPTDTAKLIYRMNYWDLLQLDLVSEISDPIAREVFDTGVNCGIGFAGRSLQRCLNAFNRGEKDFSDIVVDGIVGRVTISSLRRFLVGRSLNGETVLLRALNGLQGARYIELAECRPKDERFVFGWFLKRVTI